MPTLTAAIRYVRALEALEQDAADSGHDWSECPGCGKALQGQLERQGHADECAKLRARVSEGGAK